jgi:hypothetical protein
MCRSIIQLRAETPATDEAIEAAALQFVRKISGFRKPSRANEEAFARAVADITESSRTLLEGLVVRGRPRGAATGE